MDEFFVRLLATPVLGKLVTRRPLTIFGLYSNGDELVGISARFLRKEKIAQLEFENDEIAREFIKINALEK